MSGDIFKVYKIWDIIRHRMNGTCLHCHKFIISQVVPYHFIPVLIHHIGDIATGISPLLLGRCIGFQGRHFLT